MKFNIFKIPVESVDDLKEDLESHEYDPIADAEHNDYGMTLYVLKKSTKSEGWIEFYKAIMSEDTYQNFARELGSETLAGVYFIERDDCCYAVTHGYAHFIVKKYCDKDFGLNLAERIAEPSGLKMKHSQTFTSNSKKDITSYTQRRAIGDSFDYGEAFSYVKCKTQDKNKWGETVDFGESARFTSGKTLSFTPKSLSRLISSIHEVLGEEPSVKLPRYQIVKDKAIICELNKKLRDNFEKHLTDVVLDDYWQSGVSFYFSDNYRYMLKFKEIELTGKCDALNIDIVKNAILKYRDRIKKQYENIKVLFYDENDEIVFNKKLFEVIQVSLFEGTKNYVLHQGEWVEFSSSYIEYIESQVDDMEFSIKDSFMLNETALIERLSEEGNYTPLHTHNVYVKGKYCIELADLMDNDYVIMIKDERNTSDLVYLIRQATSSIKLTETRVIEDNVFSGKYVCLWMLLKRESLNKLSDFKSFHLIDALVEFKHLVASCGLTPVVWISLNSLNNI